ncbi:hypothetical protein VCV18_002524 [Metarhizium anisopliae]
MHHRESWGTDKVVWSMSPVVHVHAIKVSTIFYVTRVPSPTLYVRFSESNLQFAIKKPTSEGSYLLKLHMGCWPNRLERNKIHSNRLLIC